MNINLDTVFGVDDQSESSKLDTYKLVKEHVEIGFDQYLCNMAEQLSIKIGNRVSNWIAMIRDGDRKAVKAWCFAVEYLPNLFHGTQRSLEVLMMEELRSARGLREETKSMLKSTGKKGGRVDVTEFENLTAACHEALICVRRKWRRTMKKKGKMYVLMSRLKDVNKSAERDQMEFHLYCDGYVVEDNGRVSDS